MGPACRRPLLSSKVLRGALALAGDGEPRRRRTGRSRLQHNVARRDDDQSPDRRFRRAQYAEYGPVDRPRQSLNRTALGEPDHGEQRRDDVQQWFAMAFDGKVPVHVNAIEQTRNNVKWTIETPLISWLIAGTPPKLHFAETAAELARRVTAAGLPIDTL